MRQIMLRTTEFPVSRLSVDAIGEKPLGMSLFGDGSGHLRWAPGPGQRRHVYSYYGTSYFASCSFVLRYYPSQGVEINTSLSYIHICGRSAPIFATFLDRDTVQKPNYYYLHIVLASTAIGLRNYHIPSDLCSYQNSNHHGCCLSRNTLVLFSLFSSLWGVCF